MLHPINAAAEAALRNVLAFQRKVLAYACQPTLGVPLSRQEMDAYFGEQAGWLWRHESLHSPITNLNAAVRGDGEVRGRVLAAFDNDVAFDAHVDDPAFKFACCQLSAGMKILLGEFLVVFYDLLGRKGGFSAEITGSGALTRDRVVQEFWAANPRLNVCPCCDGPRPDKTNGKIHAQCDHHFPKSVHAALSIHPRNLIPICVECNVTFKSEHDANDKAHISAMFLPYEREAFGPLVARAFRDKSGVLTVEISDAGITNTSRIESLDYILQLRGRWADRLGSRVSESIVNTFRQQSRSAARRGDPPADILPNVVAQRIGFRECRGKLQDSILSEAYCVLLEGDRAELTEVFD